MAEIVNESTFINEPKEESWEAIICWQIVFECVEFWVFFFFLKYALSNGN